MARFLAALLAGLGALAASGCATTADIASTRTTASPSKSDLYVSQVEAVARTRGVRVHWVNPPVFPR